MRHVAASFLFFLGVCVIGCRTPDTLGPAGGGDSPITIADVSYDEVASAYNATLEPFDPLWVRTAVDIEWIEVDDDGDRRYRSESGDGKFIFRRPGDTVLTVEKLGKIYLWAGSDDRRYWMFDLVDGDNKTAYVGSFDRLGRPGTRTLPMPVRPDTVPYLLGLMPLPLFDDGGPVVELYEGRYLIDLPGLRMLIDPATNRPTRVDLTSPAGFSVLTAELEGRFPVEVAGVPDPRLPFICRKARVYVAGYESRLTVEMDYATTDPGRVNGRMFDFEALTRSLKPAVIEDLDAAP